MPKFVNSGPIVPDELVQALEDDRVVIFCGAGISMGAGLPSYSGLVRYCYSEMGAPLPGPRKPDWLWPDRMLGALESEYGTSQVRAAVRRCLSEPPLSLDLHEAILRLSRLRGEVGTRLVTTNFDTLFEQAKTGMSFGKDMHSGPILPIPRNDKVVSWRSVVYLHGRLDAVGNNDHLVLTSADFGRSYLTDAWAARFVARLFNDFTVLFIGYSLNDPVLRYMTDAFAAEDSTSRFAPRRAPAYIFVSHKGRSAPDATPYDYRNLKPIFYKETKDHRYLRKTIIAWADAREDYLKNTAQLIARTASKPPASMAPSDAANVVWAVCGRPNDAGHGAKAFADLSSLPPIEWFDEFLRRDTKLLEDHGKEVMQAQEDGRVVPPSPLLFIEPLFPHARDLRYLDLSPQSFHLARWLARHIGDYGFVSRLIHRIATGYRLHPMLLREIRLALNKRTNLKPGFAKLWTIITSTSNETLALGREWPFELKIPDSLAVDVDRTLAFKLELLSAIRPAIRLRRPFETTLPEFNAQADGEDARGQRLSEISDTKVIIPGDSQAELLVNRIIARDDSSPFTASLLHELTALLRRAMDLFSLTDKLSENHDISVYHRPSIVPHAQNRAYEKWTLLITLIWDGWQHFDLVEPAASRRLIEQWLAGPYVALRRLGVAALNHSKNFTPAEKMRHLLDG